ncbi:MAG: hypothetical protein PHH26_02310 [Candidatus Thermoplasmatota archaeon]|nr:hypothetical protein [Candidatus Thermoplasmatota archaeon]
MSGDAENASVEIGPLVPMAIAFVGIGLSLLAALPFVDDQLGAIVDLGAAMFLIFIGAVCAAAAKAKGEFKTLRQAVGKQKEN